MQITVGFSDLPRKRVVYDRRNGELVELGPMLRCRTRPSQRSGPT